jgi:hypothetical protein
MKFLHIIITFGVVGLKLATATPVAAATCENESDLDSGFPGNWYVALLKASPPLGS